MERREGGQKEEKKILRRGDPAFLRKEALPPHMPGPFCSMLVFLLSSAILLWAL